MGNISSDPSNPAKYMMVADLFEVAALIGACFIVNYVTADSKTNWAEGMSMIIFYAMIVSYFILMHWLS